MQRIPSRVASPANSTTLFPYNRLLMTTWSPAWHCDTTASDIAAIPLAVTVARSAPCSTPTFLRQHIGIRMPIAAINVRAAFGPQAAHRFAPDRRTARRSSA